MPGEKQCSSVHPKPNIGIVGAGMAGICAAIKIKTELGIDSFTIFEQNEDVGGVWFSNTYPGSACDLASALYSYSFELNRNLTQHVSSQAEVQNYFKSTAQKYGVYSQVKFNTVVKKMTWNENILKWIVVTVDNKKENSFEKETIFDIVIICPGNLREPYIPKGFETFEGPIFHSGQWNHEISLENKKVAVIGSGATAIQMIPAIVNTVKELHSYQRNPAYVFPRFQFQFSKFTKGVFNHFAFILWIVRCIYFITHEILYLFQLPDSILYKIANQFAKFWRQVQMPQNKRLWADLTPTFPLGNKRNLVSDEYYPAMTLPNVKLHTSPINKIKGRTIYTEEGLSQEIDVLVLATGFKAQDFFAPMEIIGKNNENILKSWKNAVPKSFYGFAFSSTPNLFYVLGPNSVSPTQSLIFPAECQTNYIVALIKEMLARNARCINLKVSAEDVFMKSLKMKMKKTVHGRSMCESWYQNPAGDVTILWPESCTQYWRETRKIDFSNFEFHS